MSQDINLRDVDVFKFMEEDDITKVAYFSQILEKKRGEPILLHGEPVAGLFLITMGEVGVYPRTGKIAIAKIGAGGVIGEMAFIENTVSSATIRVDSEKANLIYLPKNKVTEFLASNLLISSRFYQGLGVLLSSKLRLTTKKIVSELENSRNLLKQDLTRDLHDLGARDAHEQLNIFVNMVVGKLDGASQNLSELAKSVPNQGANLNLIGSSLGATSKDIKQTSLLLMSKVKALTDFVHTIENVLSRATTS